MSKLSIDSRVRVSRDLLNDEKEQRLRDCVTYDNPEYLRAILRKARPLNIPPRFCLLEEAGDTVSLPSGALRFVRELFPGEPIRDDRTSFERHDFDLKIELRDYQREAVAKLYQRQRGVLDAPTGSGKTAMGAGLIQMAGQPSLIVVNSLDLADQWRTQIDAFLGIKAGLIAGGQRDIQTITVALAQSLRDDELLRELDPQFGLVLFDECHHVPATTFSKIADALSAKFRVGVSATLERPDGLERLLYLFIGSKVHEVHRRDLEAAGVLERPRLVQVESGFGYPYAGPSDWMPMLASLVESEGRNKLITELVTTRCAGEVSLVLTGRVDHAKQLATMIGTHGLRVVAITGDMKSSERKAHLEAARRGELDCVVATQLADEGLDVPRLSRVVLAFPQRQEGRLIQRIGRILRPHPEKGESVVFDIVDPKVSLLKWQASKRLASFRSAWPSQAEVRHAG